MLRTTQVLRSGARTWSQAASVCPEFIFLFSPSSKFPGKGFHLVLDESDLQPQFRDFPGGPVAKTQGS